ncbi:hypothetical protein SNE40_014355 [Patella caerulea]
MKGSGIEEALNCIYGPNAIVHIMSGKAIARALRSLFLLDATLSYKLMKIVVSQIDQTSSDPKLSKDDINELSGLLTEFYKKDDSEGMNMDFVLESSALEKLDCFMNKVKIELTMRSRTAKLWLLFQEYVGFIREFVGCERIKFFVGHLDATTNFLNLFAATGHAFYAKSARLYLQKMRDLPNTHPNLYAQYCNENTHAVQRSGHVWNGLWTDLTIEQTLMSRLKGRGGLTHGRGLTESVRHMWIYTMHHFAQFHDAMTSLTGKRHKSSEQHTEFGESRRARDTCDLTKLIAWFDKKDPFDLELTELMSLSTGLTATQQDNINCDEAESVGYQIQIRLDNCTYESASMKRTSKVKTLEDLKPSVKIGGKELKVEEVVLFLRCTALAKRQGKDPEKYFEYEMSAVPSSLFDGPFMRHADKADLANEILEEVKPTPKADTPQTMMIIDGGWLLNKVRWKKSVRYRDVFAQYRKFVREKFGIAVIVFDGYDASTKDHEHKRRLLNAKKRANNITIEVDNEVHEDQSAFFTNVHNKTAFIRELAEMLKTDGHAVTICNADADTVIVQKALNFAKNEQNVTVVANDTDVLIMIIYHWTDEMSDIFFRRETQSKKNIENTYRIRDITIPAAFKQNILFAHAWSGCDTTSHCYGFGKNTINGTLKSDKKAQKLSKLIVTSSIQQTVGDAGCKLFSLMYGEPDVSLTKLRHQRFDSMMAEKNSITLPRIPPTVRAAYYHALRVHLQVVVWLQLNESELNASEWGWKKTPEGYEPIMTDLPAAPESVLNFVRCKCKSPKNQCGTMICSCRKNGLKCVSACGGCHGESCRNSEDVDLEDDDQ